MTDQLVYRINYNVMSKRACRVVLVLSLLCFFFVWYNFLPRTILSGLKADGKQFKLDNKPFTILSGAIHYFRVVPEYWEDRLLKLKALGLNTVETYVPWNLHEPTPGVYNFDGGLDIRKYVELAQKVGLLVIIRPGPFICAEWEFGGLPSWLLRDRELQIRSLSSPFLRAVDRYLDNLFPLLTRLQYTKGGPIIAFQVENEYGNYGDSSRYIQKLYDTFILNGVSELIFTSDGLRGIRKQLLPSVLQTVNFQFKPDEKLKEMKILQPNKPLMVMEYWPGWFDDWGGKHRVMDPERVVETVRAILSSGSSINFYMFHGGTNFGFMNGGIHGKHGYQPTITSYDYDSPISEAGDITPKFHKIHKLLKELKPTNTIPDKLILPPPIKKASYGTVKMTKYLSLENMISFVEGKVRSDNVMPMEDLPINNGAGQSYGYILYRTVLPDSAKELVIEGVKDYGQVFISQKAKEVIKWPTGNARISINSLGKALKGRVLDILVENCGRVNVGRRMVDQRKGIISKVEVDKQQQTRWEMMPLDFNDMFVKNLLKSRSLWVDIPSSLNLSPPAMFKGSFSITGKPKDTFLDMKGWNKGVVFINSHNLGRYWKIGPQETLYVPAPWLQEGPNTIMIFEQHPSTSDVVKLVKEHRLGPRMEHQGH